jgi:sigma-E factor negative regulatory protein RseC
MSRTPDPEDRRALRRALRVASVEDGVIEVEIDRASGCAACAARAGCATGALAEMAAGAPLRLGLPSGASVRPGDEVVVAIPAGGFLGAVGAAYLLPPLVLVLAVGLLTALGLPDLAVAALSLPVFALSFWPVHRIERRGRVLADLSIVDILPKAPGQGA